MTRRPALALSALALAGLTGLAGCGTPVPQPRPQDVDGTVPVLTEDQTQAITQDVAQVAQAADATGDAALLPPRFAGAAQQMRAARYALRAHLPRTPAPEPLGQEALRTLVPQADADVTDPAELSGGAAWPRTQMTVTQAEGQDQPRLSVLAQESPRAPYRVVATTGLLPGATLPSTVAPSEGSELVAPDSTDVAVPPAEVVARYARALTDPRSTAAATFAPDAFRSLVTAEQAEQDAVPYFDYTATHGPRKGAVWSYATADGGAVTVAVLEATRVQRNGAPGAVLQLPADAAALAGRDDAPQSAATRYLEVVAFAVPPAGSDAKVSVIGADRALVDATAT